MKMRSVILSMIRWLLPKSWRRELASDIANTEGADISGVTIGMVSGSSFFNCLGLFESREEPVVFGDGNVIWPPGWTDDDAAHWRRKHGVPGREWDLERTVH